MKDALSSPKTLAYFDGDARTKVIADAGPVGLGGIMIQEQNGERVICYARCSLIDVERRYSHTEKEALALFCPCERFHLYLYGREFELITDHKPLEYIYAPSSKPSAHAERWVLRLQAYQYRMKYKPGKTNISDCLSRLIPEKNKSSEISDFNEKYINFVAKTAVPVAMTAAEIEAESENDHDIRNLRVCIRSNDWGRCKIPKICICQR